MNRQRKTEQRKPAREERTLNALERELSVFLRRAVRSFYREEQDAGALDRWNYALLVRLYDEGPLRVGEVARRFGIDKSTASRHLGKLQEDGLVEAISDERDARSVLLRVTHQGEASLLEARQARMEPMRRLFDTWPEQDQSELTRLLTRLNEDLDRLGVPPVR